MLTINIDQAVIVAILAIFGIGLTGLIQALKTLFKWDGTKALLLAAVCTLGATAFTLLTAHTFGWIPFLIYGACVFGEVTGLYHLEIKKGEDTAMTAALNAIKYIQRLEKAKEIDALKEKGFPI